MGSTPCGFSGRLLEVGRNPPKGREGKGQDNTNLWEGGENTRRQKTNKNRPKHDPKSPSSQRSPSRRPHSDARDPVRGPGPRREAQGREGRGFHPL